MIRTSCDLLENGSVNLTYRGIDACCFMYDNGTNGSPGIFNKISDVFPADDYFAWREAAIKRAESGDATFPCTNCPQRVSKDWPDRVRKIKYLIVTPTQACQLDCHYCWSVHDGSKKKEAVSFDAFNCVKSMHEAGLFDANLITCIGGGEPTVSRNFDRLFSLLQPMCKQIHMPTNSVKLSKVVVDKLKISTNILLITSLDCGTEQGFMRERGGKNYFSVVVKNLATYYAANKKSVVIKYIVTKTNCDIAELDAFVTLVNKDFVGIEVYIDLDIRDTMVDKQLYAAAYLYDKLSATEHKTTLGDATTTRIKSFKQICTLLATGTFLVNLFTVTDAGTILGAANTKLKIDNSAATAVITQNSVPAAIPTSTDLIPGVYTDLIEGFYAIENNATCGIICWTKLVGVMAITAQCAGVLSFDLRPGHFPLYELINGQLEVMIKREGVVVDKFGFTTSTSHKVTLGLTSGVTRIEIICSSLSNGYKAGYSDDARDLGLLVHNAKFYGI